MQKIIVDKQLVESPFHVVDGETALQGDHLIVPLRTYLDHIEQFRARDDVGVWLDADEEAESLCGIANDLPVIGLNFPTFFDGRSLSNATIIRRKLGYEGELRAIGDVRRDQLEQMQRCGINAFQLAENQDMNDAIANLDAFTYNYQGSINRPQPLFRSHRLQTQ